MLLNPVIFVAIITAKISGKHSYLLVWSRFPDFTPCRCGSFFAMSLRKYSPNFYRITMDGDFK